MKKSQGLAIGCAVFVIAGGCINASRNTTVLRTAQDPSERAMAAMRLGECTDSGEAIEALLVAANDEAAAVRYFAVDSLGNIAEQCNDISVAKKIKISLAKRLTDDTGGQFSDLGAFGVIGVNRYVGTVRARALLALTSLTGRDFGFDEGAWVKFISDSEPLRFVAGRD